MEAITDIFSQHFAPYSRKLALLVSIVMVVLIGVSVAQTVVFFIENVNDDAMVPTATTPRAAVKVSPTANLADLNLFGSVEKKVESRAVDAPQTNLNLELQGVFTAEDPEDSTAIVAERGKSGELFQIGDRLPGNAILDAVFDDHILIKRGNRIEKLMFSDAALRQQANSAVTGTSVTSRAVGGTQSPSTRLENIRERIAQRRDQVQAGAATGESPNALSPVRTALLKYRDRLGTNPDDVLKEVGISPVAAGEANGYRISGEIPEAALRQSGLQRGDLILSVNGTPVGNVVNDQAMIDQALTAGRVRVEVQREERKFFLTVPVP